MSERDELFRCSRCGTLLDGLNDDQPAVTDAQITAAAKAMWGGKDWEAAGRCYPWNPELRDCQEAMRQVRIGFDAAARVRNDDG